MRISRLQGKMSLDSQDNIIQEQFSASPLSTASRDSLSSSPIPQLYGFSYSYNSSDCISCVPSLVWIPCDYPFHMGNVTIARAVSCPVPLKAYFPGSLDISCS